MDMFEKATKAAKNVGDSVINSARSIGNTLYSSTKEQSELASLNVQKSVIEKKLNEVYAKIGKRYVEYINTCEGETCFEVDDLLEEMQPDMDKMAEIKAQIQEKEVQIKQANEERIQKKAQAEFDAEKRKLDKALELDVVNEEEYAEKLAAAQRKLDNYDVLRKIEMQLEMGIITKEEYLEKKKNILQ